MAFEIAAAVLLVLIGVAIGYAMFVKRADPYKLEIDQDFVDCQDTAGSTSELIICYTDKKSRQVKDYLKETGQ